MAGIDDEHRRRLAALDPARVDPFTRGELKALLHRYPREAELLEPLIGPEPPPEAVRRVDSAAWRAERAAAWQRGEERAVTHPTNRRYPMLDTPHTEA